MNSSCDQPLGYPMYVSLTDVIKPDVSSMAVTSQGFRSEFKVGSIHVVEKNVLTYLILSLHCCLYVQAFLVADSMTFIILSPRYVSPLTTSYAGTHRTLRSIGGGALSLDAIRSWLCSKWLRSVQNQHIAESQNSLIPAS